MVFIDHEYKLASRRARSISLFWRRFPTGPLASCWEWRGAKTEDGYGTFGIKPWRAHVISWELNHARPVPVGMQVCHKCDNPGCVNPWHLFLGTHQINVDDKVSKGRQYRVVTDDQVVEIRGLRERGLSHRAIAKLTGVKHSSVRFALTKAKYALHG